MADDWETPRDELARRRAEARAMGGEAKLEKQRRGGRLDARARIEALFDEGSFQELGTLVGGVARGAMAPAPADALIAGFGEIDGRPVLAGSEDFTVQGGSIGLGTHAKRVRLATLAAQERVPLVMMLDGAGERATNSLERYPYAPNDLQALAALSGLTPTVCLVMGPSAGHGALTAPLMDFVVMVEGAALFSAGPPLVQIATGESVTKEELGGSAVHTAASGVAHNRVEDDAGAIALARHYLGYFPSNAWSRPPMPADCDTGTRWLDELLEIVPANPSRPYDMRRVLAALADRDSVLEIQPAFGQTMITALARLGGRPLAIVANQPAVRAGAIEPDSADKAARFLDIADAFSLPALFLADNPGVMAGPAAERSGALRSAARLFFAQAKHRGPKFHVTLRKAYGFGSSVMAMNPFDQQTLSLALPVAHLGAMPAAGGGRAAHAGDEVRQQLRAAEHGGPWSAADTMSYDEVVDPRELREVLLRGLRLAAARLSANPQPARRTGIRP